MPAKQKLSAARAMRGKRGRPKKTVAAPKQPVHASVLRQMIRSVRWTDSYTSFLMGVIVVIVAVLFVVSFLKQTHHLQQTSSTSTIATSVPTVTVTPSELKPTEKTYTVKLGDDLWHIAETFYSSGYNWVDIAKANNLSDPSVIHSGNTLIIPQVTPEVATVTITPSPTAVQPAPSTNTITGTSYTIQKGDSLWSIAVRAYADGYQWVKIAKANNLANPNLIFSGNVLTIPR